jgi:hypothetical protein
MTSVIVYHKQCGFLWDEIPALKIKKMTRKILLVCGILASLLYVAMNIFIPMQWPEYDLASQTVSELSAIDAPTRPLWFPLGLLYAALGAAFGLGVLDSAANTRSLQVLGVLLFLNGLINLFWPPMHQRAVLAAGGATITDTMHLIFAGVTVLLFLLTLGFGAASFGKSFRIYSITTIILLAIFGGLTALDAPRVEADLLTPFAGVWERINTGVYLAWVIVLAILLLKDKTADHFLKSKIKNDIQ